MVSPGVHREAEEHSRLPGWSAKPHIAKLVETVNRQDLYEHSATAQAMLRELLRGKARLYGPKEWELFLNKLGMTSRPVSWEPRRTEHFVCSGPTLR